MSTSQILSCILQVTRSSLLATKARCLQVGNICFALVHSSCQGGSLTVTRPERWGFIKLTLQWHMFKMTDKSTSYD